MYNRGLTILLLVVILAIILIGGFFYFNTQVRSENGVSQDTRTSEDGNALKQLIEVPLLTNKNTTTSNPSAHYTTDLRFPELALTAHPELAKEANAVITAFVQDLTTKFIENATATSGGPAQEITGSDLTLNWTALLVSPSLVSIRFDYSEYVAGSAHPDNRTRILNYDFERHLLLPPTALFASSTQALPFLSSYTRSALKTKLSENPESEFNAFVMPGTAPRYENFQEVGITKTGLLVIFNPYQVAPYARGTIEVPIPLESLSPSPTSTEPILSLAVTRAIELATTNFKEASIESSSTPAN